MFFRKYKQEIERLKEDNRRLEEELYTRPRPFFGVVNAPKEEDFNKLKKNQEALEALIKVLVHRTVIKMDGLRDTKDFNGEYLKKIGYLDALNETVLLLKGYLAKPNDDDEFTGQNLR